MRKSMANTYAYLPRLSELIAEYEGKYSSIIWAEWQNLNQDREICKHFAGIETFIGTLALADWTLMKCKIVPRFHDHDSGRGRRQAFDILNEAVAYKILAEHGATDMAFVPEDVVKTPDICGQFDGSKFYCEVKTKNESEVEIVARGEGRAVSTQNRLPDQYFVLLGKQMKDAEAQFAGLGGAKHIFLILNFDDRFHEYLDEYFVQLKDWIGSHKHDYDKCWFWAREKFQSRISDKYRLLVYDKKSGTAFCLTSAAPAKTRAPDVFAPAIQK